MRKHKHKKMLKKTRWARRAHAWAPRCPPRPRR